MVGATFMQEKLHQLKPQNKNQDLKLGDGDNVVNNQKKRKANIDSSQTKTARKKIFGVPGETSDKHKSRRRDEVSIHSAQTSKDNEEVRFRCHLQCRLL